MVTLRQLPILAFAVVLLVASTGALSFSRFPTKTGVRVDDTIVVPKVRTIDFGADKTVDFLALPDHLNRQLSTGRKRGMKVSTDDGAGDIVWPSSFALARLIAHCPNLVNGRDVLELGCGLGLVSAAACKHARPAHVAVSDRDSDVLGMAYASCTQLQRSRASVSRTCLDWSDRSTWPNQKFDVLLASDVLYERSSILPLVEVLSFYLGQPNDDDDDEFTKRAIVVDQTNQANRDAFCYAAHRAGLDVDETPFPGMEEFTLISITPLL
jgi:hypothetical protein